MILLYRILIRFILIMITVFLFSYNSYGAHDKNRITSTSTKIDYNTSHNLSSSVKYHIKQKVCVYNEVNRRELIRITCAQTSQKQYDKLHSFVLKAIHHPADCLLTHSLDQVSAIFIAASACKDHRAIELLAGNLIKGDIKITNDTWSYMHIWKLNSAIYTYTSPSVIRLREIIASHIVNPNNDMSTWEPTGFTYVLSSLVKDSSNKEKEALQKLVAYLITKNCNIDKWGGKQLSLLFNSLAQTNVENTDIAMVKVLNTIIKLGLSFWNTKSASTILKSLAAIRREQIAKILNHESYTKALNLIMDYLVNPNIKFKDCNSITISSLMQSLWKIRTLVNSDKILIVRHKLAEVIISKNTHMPFLNSNDWMCMIRGLNYKYDVEKEAIRVLADCLNAKKIDLSECTKLQLLKY
ncbi:MAG: hypothetical protein QS748_06270 [Candidatus Endonucleobacter bathymodioli]|uniref:Uncharacterized protein n=1 Tax=Candidatus Endonucleibacter bathymodioli TaxID=539814 RepID=A0AA90SXQ0_9GAMM|nr:hypothetical protein [Candidatus Endonucleobacter bathymodioli]